MSFRKNIQKIKKRLNDITENLNMRNIRLLVQLVKDKEDNMYMKKSDIKDGKFK